MYNNQFMLDNLNRQKDRLDEMIKNYQSIPQTPINNFINTNQISNNMYELRKLTDEVENIAVMRDTIFINDEKMEIKKLDGTIEKYSIKKTYPKDKKDEEIERLNNKLKEMEMKLNEYNTSIIKSNTESSKQAENVGVNDKSSTTKSNTRISKSK